MALWFHIIFKKKDKTHRIRHIIQRPRYNLYISFFFTSANKKCQVTWKVASLLTINNKLLYNFCNARANKKKKRFPFFPLYFQRETVILTNNYTHLWGKSSWTDTSQTQSRDACDKIEVTLLQCVISWFLNLNSKTFKVASDFLIEDGSQKKKKEGEGAKRKKNETSYRTC